MVTVRDFTKFRIPPTPFSSNLKQCREFSPPHGQRIQFIPLYSLAYPPGWPGVLPLGQADYMYITCLCFGVLSVIPRFLVTDDYSFPFSFFIFSCSVLPKVLGDSLLQICLRHIKLHSACLFTLCAVLISINHRVQWIRVDHPRFLRGPLSGRVEANLRPIATHEAKRGKKMVSEARRKMHSSESALTIFEVANPIDPLFL